MAFVRKHFWVIHTMKTGPRGHWRPVCQPIYWTTAVGFVDQPWGRGSTCDIFLKKTTTFYLLLRDHFIFPQQWRNIKKKVNKETKHPCAFGTVLPLVALTGSVTTKRRVVNVSISKFIADMHVEIWWRRKICFYTKVFSSVQLCSFSGSGCPWLTNSLHQHIIPLDSNNTTFQLLR